MFSSEHHQWRFKEDIALLLEWTPGWEFVYAEPSKETHDVVTEALDIIMRHGEEEINLAEIALVPFDLPDD